MRVAPSAFIPMTFLVAAVAAVAASRTQVVSTLRARPEVPARSDAGRLPPAQMTAETPEGVWHAAAALPLQIAEIAAAELDGIIYTGGGFSPVPEGVTRWFGAYDGAADAWTEKAMMPEALNHFGMASAGGRVWLSGGYIGSGFQQRSKRLFAYDPSDNAWIEAALMPGGRAAHSLVAIGERLYLVGGTGDDTASMWVYDLNADGWHVLPGPIPREHLGAGSAGGKVFVVAGRGFGRDIVATLEVFDPRLGTWERLPDMPQGCGGCSASVTVDGRLHVTGGEDAGGTHAEHFVFDPAVGEWHRAADLPTSRHGIGAAAVDDRFYVIGGGRRPGLDYSDVVEWWSPASAPSATPTEHVSETPTATVDRATASVTPLDPAVFLPVAEG